MLTRCIGVDPATFERDHWGRRPLLSTADTLPRDFGDLLSAGAVDELISERGVRAPFIRMAKEGALVGRDCYVGPAGFGAEMPDQVDSAKVLAQFADGATIVLQGLHRLWPPLIDFVRRLIDDVGHPIQANAYVTPPANRGFDPHYDVHDVFVLQIAGRKHWTIHEPVHVDPLTNEPWTDHRAAIEKRAQDEPVIDTVLEPGDCLYLPRGWVHSAVALGETSIHITVGVAAVTGVDVVRALLDVLGTESALRASLPLGVDLADRAETVAVANKTIATLVDTLRDNASELGEAAAAQLTATFAERTRAIPVRPLATLDTVAGLTDDVRVRWRRGLIGSLRRADDRIEIVVGDRVISFPESCADAVEALHSGSTHDARTLPGLDAADSRVVIRRLLREAVIVPAHLSRTVPG